MSSPITIIRKIRDEYEREEISTETILPGSELTPEQNRANIVARLREDPTVFMVFEPIDGVVSETVTLPSGYTFYTQFIFKDYLQASLKITREEEVVYENTFQPYETKEGCSNPLDDLIEAIIEELYSIDAGEYDYDDPEIYEGNLEPMSIYDALTLLKGKGYQVERINTVEGFGLFPPFLLVHENEVILVGSRYYEGERLFLEMKRFYFGESQRIETANRVVSSADPHLISLIHWEDGSWSFRFQIDIDLTNENFEEQMNATLAVMRAYVKKVEEQSGIEASTWEVMTRQRNFFIYETLDQSLKMSKLKV